jgi:hypothetical protein
MLSRETSRNPTASASRDCDDLVHLRGAVLAGNPAHQFSFSSLSFSSLGRDAVRPISEGDSQPAPALATSDGVRAIQETDLDADAGPVSNTFVSTRGAVPASTEGDIRIPTSAEVTRGLFTLRGQLMHAFVSYRVATEGMVLTLHQISADTCCSAARSSLESQPPLHVAHP